MKKTGKISALLCGLLLIGISGIYGLPKAYVLYQANSGKVAIHLEEYRMNGEKEVPWETEENVLPGGLISKIPRIVNDGADCYVRAKIVFTSEKHRISRCLRTIWKGLAVNGCRMESIFTVRKW